MRKTFKYLLLSALGCLTGTNAWAEDYSIASAADLMAFAAAVNGGESLANATLTADIDMKGQTWVPIGQTKAFAGTINGGGYAISNLVMTAPSDSGYCGLIAQAARGTVIKNLTIDETCSFASDMNYTAAFVCRGVVSDGSSAISIQDCVNKAKLTSQAKWTAGFVAYCAVPLNFTRCVNEGEIEAHQVGAGFIGQPTATISFADCTNKGNVTVTETSADTGKSNAAGFLGHHATQGAGIAFSNCVNEGEIHSYGSRAAGFCANVNGQNTGCSLTNCVNRGKITSEVHLPAGFISDAYIVLSMTDCRNEGEIITVNGSSGNAQMGGLIGTTRAGCVFSATRCCNTGKLEANGKNNVAAFVGYQGTYSRTTLTDCYNTADCITTGNNGRAFIASGNAGSGAIALVRCWNAGATSVTTGNTLSYQSNTVTNSYDLSNLEATYGAAKVLEGWNSDWPTGGAFAYFMNQKAGSNIYYQTLGEDDVPTFDKTHKQVYISGTYRCDGALIEADAAGTYTNDPGFPDHTFTQGVCKVCCASDPDNGLTPAADGYYELADAYNVAWFSGFVRSGNTKANARLTADIDMGEVNSFFRPIGYLNGYGGKFDGQFHTIRYFIYESSGNNAGFIANALNGMEFRNIVFDPNCYIKGAAYVGPVANTLNGQTGVITLDRIGYEGSVEGTGVNAGGILGANRGSTAIIHISNCYTTGTVKGENESAALCGWIGTNAACYVDHSWSCATVTGHSGEELYLYRWGSSGGSNSAIFSTAGTQGTIIDPEDMASGKLAWMLNGATFLDPTWFQTLSTDARPTFLPDHAIVYPYEETYANVSAGDASSVQIFRDYLVSGETTFCDDAIAYQAAIDAYREEVDAWGSLETLDEIMEAYRTALPKRKTVEQSAAVYAEYTALCASIREQVAGNTGQTPQRALLDAYLDENEITEPGDFPNGNYGYIYAYHLLTNEQVTAEMAYANQLLRDVLRTSPNPGSDMTVFLTNPDLSDGWNGWTAEPLSAMTIGGEENLMKVGRGLNSAFSLSQSFEGAPNGIYELRVNAFSRTGADITSKLYTGEVFLNGNTNYVTSIPEDAILVDEAVDSVNCLITGGSADAVYTDYVTGETSYVPKALVGCSFAFGAGRYENRVAVEVTDGKLTLGIRDRASSVDNWLPFGNFRLIYLGTAQEATESLTDVLKSYVDRATTIRDFVADEADPARRPNMSEQLKTELSNLIDEAEDAETGEQKMDIINRFTNLFDRVYTCRMAYIELMDAITRLNTSSEVLFTSGLITEAEFDDILDETIAAGDAYTMGTVTEAEAKELIEKLNQKSESLGIPPVKEGKYQLATVHDMQVFATLVNNGDSQASALLTADLDMADAAWTPITGTNAYTGTFDGGGHTIQNLGAPLFANTGSGVAIKNLTLEGAFEGQTVFNLSTGAFIAYHTGNVITLANCVNKTDITNSTAENTGGIVGRIANVNAAESLNISNCVNEGNITGHTSTTITNNGTGGIIGWASFPYNDGLCATFTDCENRGTITGGRRVGGIIGYCSYGNDAHKQDFVRCANTGSISGVTMIGGLLGYINSSTNYTDCSNSGTVTGSTAAVGGIVGQSNNSYGPRQVFTGCSNTGTISSTGGNATTASCQQVGGLIGYTAKPVTMTECFNTGAITAQFGIGGLAGQINNGATSAFTRCYNTGDIVQEVSSAATGSKVRVGSFVGLFYNMNPTLTDCYNIGSVTEDRPYYGSSEGSFTATVNNSYDVNGSEGYFAPITQEQVTNGELCYLLNGDQTTISFFQTLGDDAYPVLDITHLAVLKADNGTYYNDETGIQEVTTDYGQRTTDAIYDLSGRRVEKMIKGIYIVNGKKVLK